MHQCGSSKQVNNYRCSGELVSDMCRRKQYRLFLHVKLYRTTLFLCSHNKFCLFLPIYNFFPTPNLPEEFLLASMAHLNISFSLDPLLILCKSQFLLYSDYFIIFFFSFLLTLKLMK